jgi:threonine dehydrogenase-like Zn-dependent dehydrogenase
MTEPRGTLVLKSTFHGAATVETWPTVVKELTVVGSRCGPFDKAIALLHSGKVDPRTLVTRTFSLSEAPAAIRFAPQPGVMKGFVEGCLTTVPWGRYRRQLSRKFMPGYCSD